MSQTQLTLRVPSHLHKALKLASVNEDQSIQDIAKRTGLAEFF
jgi:predicted HicB family RNase H-like nuclease